MIGIYLCKMGEYVTSRYGAEVWEKAKADSGVAYKVYLPGEPYPDEELNSLTSSVCKETHISSEQLWEDIGLSAGSSVIAAYQSLIDPEWKTMEILEYLQPIIDMIRKVKGNFPHPWFETTRVSENTLIMSYSSPRKLCALAKGMTKGIAQHYGEKIAISEESCMHQGAPACRIVVTLVS